MNNSESIHQPFEFDSPVEFVLIATVGMKRAVVAKSKGAQLDLVAYAQRDTLDEEERPTFPVLFPFPFPVSMQLHPFSIDSLPMRIHSNHEFDQRGSKCTLVWRGAGYKRHRRRIEKEFCLRIEDILHALDQHSPSRLEWVLSPVIDLCHRATIYSRQKRFTFVGAFWFVILVYAFGIGAFFFKRLLQ